MTRFYIIFIYLAVLLISENELCIAKYINLREFTEAVRMSLNFTSRLIGNEVTEELSQQFELGSKLEETRLNIEQLIPKHGYKVEKYNVITEDGYILTLFRIPSSGRPLLLMHGLVLSADDWVTPGPDTGIAYQLASAGFDIWLGNIRGNKHSRRHVRLSPNSFQFWDFSWHEMGRYDLPAIIDHVLHVTKQSQLIYVAHSQGSAIFYIMGSERPQYTKKVSLMIGLAPVSRIKNVRSPLLLLWKHITPLPTETLLAMLRKLGLYDILQLIDGLVKDLAPIVCGRFQIVKSICSNFAFLFAGYNLSHMNMTTFPAVVYHSPAGGAPSKHIEHYAQTVTSGKFDKFNYGEEKNVLLYGSRSPPEYNIGSISTPMAILYSGHDWLVTEPDIFYLRKRLSNVVFFHKVKENYGHLDFLYAIDVKNVIVSKVLKLIKTFVA